LGFTLGAPPPLRDEEERLRFLPPPGFRVSAAGCGVGCTVSCAGAAADAGAFAFRFLLLRCLATS